MANGTSTSRPRNLSHIAPRTFGIELYVLHIVIKPGDDSSGSCNSTEIASITWETNNGGIYMSEAQAKKQISSYNQMQFEA